MRQCLLALFVLSTRVLAAPSEEVIKSCLSATAVDGVSLTAIETREIYLEENYRSGYQAEYLLFRGMEIGVARSQRGDALVYRGLLHPLRRATALPQTRTKARQPIQVALAEWSLIRENGKQYLCVSDQFDGIGRSGSFQKARYGYLLETRKKGRLFFLDGMVD
ncbi:hypothetical protein RC55_16095 [Herbaspirillum seropedicae]|uniref:Uncharacterized protein n=1 Tax=Herbaspirillum seropedicae (strain SmR1) TaxID=757424 RepID=D8IXV3_HERSS|nr:hypothetical protein Hsero_2709 [Herbaspirillum seropedicae SmR1]AKN66159.1 hypothetical protein ACP92_13580 [Herbaspirillum seropedicae]NQE30754.1 hypothetical protein [Herbaspirillum seropedicae]